MPQSESFVVSLAAAATAALIGVVSFWVFHTLWILNVPTVLMEGLFHAVPATFAVAWAIRRTRRAGRFRAGLRDGLALGLLFWLTLVPYEVVGAMWGPWTDPENLGDVLSLLWLAFLGVPVGAAIGWAVAREAFTAAAWAVATLTLDVFLGGGIAFNGGSGTMLGLFLWLLPTHLLAGVTLVSMHAVLGRRARLVAGSARH